MYNFLFLKQLNPNRVSKYHGMVLYRKPSLITHNALLQTLYPLRVDVDTVSEPYHLRCDNRQSIMSHLRGYSSCINFLPKDVIYLYIYLGYLA